VRSLGRSALHPPPSHTVALGTALGSTAG